MDYLTRILTPTSLTAMSKQRGVLDATRFCVRAYYAATPVLAMVFMTRHIETKSNFDPFGPLQWITKTDLTQAEVILLTKLGFMVTALTAAFWYRSTTVRVLLCIAIMQVHAIESSFGSINHQWYTWYYTSFILIFLPDIWHKPKATTIRTALLVLWTSIASIMLTYTMAGVHKFYNVLDQWQLGEIHGFSKEAFLYQATWWVPHLQEPAYLLPYLETFPYIAWTAYVGVHFLQLFAIWCAIRTKLLLPFTILFIFFHFGTYLTMGITFQQNMLLLCALVLTSPFIDRHATLRDMYRDLPVVPWAVDTIAKKYRSVHQKAASALR